MNINLSTTKKKKKLGFGLNQRGTKNVLDNDDDDDNNNAASSGSDESSRSNNNNPQKAKKKQQQQSSSSRASVNQAIADEQAALRKRAQAAMEANISNNNSEVYDYDGAYDSFHKQQTADDNDNKKKDESDPKEKKSSRYIGDLLKAADERKREREIILERKIVKEQELEDAQVADFKGKQKYVTAAYKRKLEERQLWQQEQDKQQREEEENDVSKKKNMAGFYGNLNKNVAMGGGGQPQGDDYPKSAQEGEYSSKTEAASKGPPGLGFMEGFERASGGDEKGDKTLEVAEASDEKANQDGNQAGERQRSVLRQIREEKVAAARIRYFQRHGIGVGSD